jgi:DoxX-like protein
LKNYRILVGIFELLGGIGLLIGFLIPVVLSISAGGLAVLMFLGFIVRLKMKDGFWISFPSVFFMILNFYVFIYTINWQ